MRFLFLTLAIFALNLSFAQVTETNDGSVKTTRLPMLKECEHINPLLIEEHFNCMSLDLYNNYFHRYDIFKQMQKKDENLYYTTIGVTFTKEGSIGEITFTNSSHPQFDLEFRKYLEKKLPKVKIVAPAQNNKGEAVEYVLKYPYRAIFEDYTKQMDRRYNEMTLYTLIDTDKNERYEIRHDKEFNFRLYQTTNGALNKVMESKSMNDFFEDEYFANLLLRNNDKLLMAEKVVDGDHYRIYYSNADNHNMNVYKVTKGKEVFIVTINKGYLHYSKVLLRVIRN